MSHLRFARMLAPLLAAGAVAAPVAHAESIAYVKAGDVWLSTSDGARQYQVTATGGYSYVSQSEDGVVVALFGDRIRTLDRVTGAVVHDILTPASSSYPGTPFRGPFDPEVSPDGLTVAYSWYYTQTGESATCNPSTGCETVYGRQGTGFTRLDRLTGFEDVGYQSQSGWVTPSWLGTTAVISSDPIQVGNKQTAFMTPGLEGVGNAGSTNPWFSNDAERSLRDVERNRQRTGFAGVAGDQSEKLQIYRPGEDYPKAPTDACFELTGPAGRYLGPSWKPDGTQLAFSDDEGVHAIAIPDLSQGCGTPTETEARLLIPGGQYPDWSPADVPPARAAAPEPGPAAGSPPSVGATARLTVPGQTGRRVLRRGLLVRLAGAEPGRQTVRVRIGKRVAGTAGITVSAEGTGRVRVALRGKARRRLRAGRTVRLTVTGAGQRAAVTLR